MPITHRSKHSVIAAAAVLLQMCCASALAEELKGEVAETTKDRVERTGSPASETLVAKPDGETKETPKDETASKPVDAMKQGQEFMKSYSYAKALEAFNLAARENPASAEPHFARARALLGLGRRDEALKEFKLCMLLDPSSRMEHKCTSEIDFAALGKILDFSNQPRTITTQDLEKTTTGITNQAATEITRLQDEAVSRSSAFRRMEHLSMPSYPYSFGQSSRYRPSRGGSYSSLSSSGGRQFISNWTGGSGASVQTVTMRRSSALAEEARIRSEAIREAATGLNTNMSGKPSEYSGVYLSPHNTNLFVRNYVTFEPVRPEPPEALSAKALSLEEYHRIVGTHKPGCSYMPRSRGNSGSR